MVANNLPTDSPPLTLGMESIGQNLTFSEHGLLIIDVAYENKESRNAAFW